MTPSSNSEARKHRENTTETTFTVLPRAWWCLTHDWPTRRDDACVQGRASGHRKRCQLVPLYIQTGNT